jgi:SAM-dependent methyltransferase
LKSLDLQGKTAAQVSCNNARELLSLASLGITPTLGIDQSPAFLELGAKLSEAASQSPRLIEADIYNLPPDLGTYDLVLITIGVLNWMPDLRGFFGAVASLVNTGGRLVIYETPPMLEMFEPEDPDPTKIAYSYFEKDPIEVPEMIVYDGPTNAASGEVGYWFVHTMGDIVSACIASGLTLNTLTEYPHSNREPEYDQYENQKAQVPMCFSLVATKV